MEHNNKFNYTYSANRNEEIKRIREKYLPKTADKLTQLKSLDKIPTQKATIYSLMVGIIGTLILGCGMSLVLVWHIMLLGILIGSFGIIILSVAYPLYIRTLKTEREKIAPEILRLSDELMN